MNNKIHRAIIITGILFTITCIHQSSHVATVNKSVCLTITTTDSVAPIPPYQGNITHYDMYGIGSFYIKNNTIHLTDENKANAIDSIQLIVFATFKYEGIYSGSAGGSSYITGFPYSNMYRSNFWKNRAKPYQIVFDSITKTGNVYYNYMDNPSMLEPGTSLILKDTVYDTIRDTFSGSNAVLWVHQHIRTDSIYNLGYLPFE